MLKHIKEEILELYNDQQLSAEEIAPIVMQEQAFVENTIAEFEQLKQWQTVTI